MTWADVGIAVLGGTLIMGVETAGIIWLLNRGTDPDRPSWHSFLVGMGLLMWFLFWVATLTKLTMDGGMR